MRKLTKQQQEVIDLMKKGWELGSSMGIEGGCWLQKGGCGRGGETKQVRWNTLHTLEYLDYIEVADTKFPTKTYRLKKAKPATASVLVGSHPIHGEDIAHPSYGTISFNQAQGGKNALFGSSIKHNNVIILKICHAEKHRSNATDYVFSRGTIVEAYMSATQFADAITGHGSGGEAPVTLQFTEKDGRIDQPLFDNKREQFEAEFTKRAGEIIKRIEETISKAKDKRAPQWLVHDMEITKGWLQSNIPFLAEQFAEEMDKTVTEAKAEVEAYISGKVLQTGLATIEDMHLQLAEGSKEG